MMISSDMALEATLRALQTARFKSSPRLSRLLRFIVDETLEGRGGALKGYTIGLEVFDKCDDFDPSQDPIVRVQMGRLRQALELYYHNEGAAEPIRITLTKGCYIVAFVPAAACDALSVGQDKAAEEPTDLAASQVPDLQEPVFKAASPFKLQHWSIRAGALAIATMVMVVASVSGVFAPRERREIVSLATLTPDAGASWRPKIRVFASTAGNNQAAAFKTAILGGLTNYATFDTTVVDQEVAVASEIDRSAVFTLSIVESTGGQNVTLRLTDEVVKKVVWATTTSALDLDIGTHESRQKSAAKLLKLFMQQRGLLFSYLAGRQNLDPNLMCIVKSSFTVSSRDTTPEVVAAAKSCLAQLVKVGGTPIAKALYANLHVPPFDMKSSSDLALGLAHNAATEAPRNAIVQRSMMVAYWNSGQTETALRAGAIAVAANPLSGDVAAAYGFHLIMAGAFREGVDVLTTALEDLLPGDPCWDLGLFLGHLGLGDEGGAAAIGARLARTDKADLAVARIVSLKLLSRHDEARNDLKMFSKRFPQFAASPLAAFDILRLNAKLKERLRTVLASVR